MRNQVSIIPNEDGPRITRVQLIGATVSLSLVMALIITVPLAIHSNGNTINLAASLGSVWSHSKPVAIFVSGFIMGTLFPVAGSCSISFLALIGTRASFLKEAQIASLGYLAATVFGCGLYCIGLEIPRLPSLFSVSLVALGAISILQVTLTLERALCFYFGAGLVHGAFIGISVVETFSDLSGVALLGLFFGLFGGQYLFISSSRWAAYTFFGVRDARSVGVKLLGGVVMFIGLWGLLS